MPLPELPAADRQRLVINLLIETDRLELFAGGPQPIAVPRSGNKKQKSGVARPARSPCTASTRAARCGSYARARSTTRLQVAPDVHIFTRSKLPWVTLPDSVPAFATYYDTKKLWPRASLEWLEAIAAPRDV